MAYTRHHAVTDMGLAPWRLPKPGAVLHALEYEDEPDGLWGDEYDEPLPELPVRGSAAPSGRSTRRPVSEVPAQARAPDAELAALSRLARLGLPLFPERRIDPKE